jgi:hypothetical protein
MIQLGQVRESEIVLTFLKAEINSAYGQSILQLCQIFGATSQELIDRADLDSDYYNAVRGAVLDCYRGYLRRTLLFAGFPKNVTWRRVELEPHELGRLKYIDDKDKDWMSYSQKTRLPQRVVERIARGELPGLEKKVCGIQEKLRRGELLPEIIAADGENGDLILIEGHCRATAYVGLNWSENIPMFLGSSPQMPNWYYF